MKWSHTLIVDFLPGTVSFCVSMNLPPSLLCSNASRNAISTDVWSLQGDVRTGGLVTAVFEIIFILLGLPWNVLVLVAIIKERLYHQPTIILLMNLIISDIVVLAAVLPFSIITGLAGEYTMISQDVSFVDTTTLFLILSTTPASSPFPSCLSIDSYSSINLYAMKSLLLFPEF